MQHFPGEPRPASQEEDERARKIKEKMDLRHAGLKNCMEQKWFREWMMERLLSLNTFGQTFAASPNGFPDINATFYHAGMKAAGWVFWDEIDTLMPELASLMRREAMKPQ